MTKIIEALKWRYATQAFGTEKKLSEAEVDTVLEALRLAPSSFGLQPWKFIVVNNKEIRAKLREAGYGQPKITDASHLIVLAIRKNIDDAFVDKYVELTAQTRNVTVESLKGFGDAMKGSIIALAPEARNEWSTRQVYLALGVLLAAAAAEGIDAGPMEGFDPKKFDEILGLEALGLETKVIVALGHRAPTDVMALAHKVRFPREEVFMEV